MNPIVCSFQISFYGVLVLSYPKRFFLPSGIASSGCWDVGGKTFDMADVK